MRFLVSSSTFVAPDFGIMATPSLAACPAGVRAGMEWAADNEAFAGKFDPRRFFPWLESLAPYRDRCLFVAVPDVVGDAPATLAKFRWFAPRLEGWPRAYVAQDGCEALEFPPLEDWEVLFVGGSTEWKTGPGAAAVIARALAAGKRVHVGRVNNWRRFRHFAELPGGEGFTCDGTRNRFAGLEPTVKLWRDYMGRPLNGRLDFGGAL